MNLKRIITAILAVSALLTACKQEEELGVPKLTVTPSELSIEAGEGTASVEILATRDWYIASRPDWLALNIDSGQASSKPQTVTVSYDANAGYNRTGELKFSIGLAKASLTVSQKGAKGELKMGSGTKEDPFTVAAACNAVKDLTWTDQNNYQKVGPFYVKGIISTVDEAYSAQFGNGTFHIKDPEGDAEFYVYRALYLGNKKWTASDKQIKAGNEVIIYGELMNYRSNTPETVQNSSYLYSLNGETGGGPVDPGTPSGTGTKEDPFNVAAAVKAVENLTWTSNDVYDKVGPYYVKGKISSVKEEYSTSFGNGSFYIKDDSGDAEFYVFRALFLENKKWTTSDKQIKAGDEVIIYGELMNYRSNTPETVQNSSYLYSLNGETTGSGGGGTVDPGTPSGSGTLEDPYNVPAACNAAKSLTWTSNTEYDKAGPYYIKGKISAISQDYTYNVSDGRTYGNARFSISEDGTTSSVQFTLYNINYLGDAKFVAGQTDIKVGDNVILYCEIMNYRNNTPENAGGYLYSLNGETEAKPVDPGDNPGGNTGGDSQFASNVTWTDGSNGAYTQKANVNGTEVTILKLGTGSAVGSSTITCPAPSSKLTFYAVSWKDKPSELVFKVGGTQVASVKPAANSGLSGNPTYKLTVTDSDKYTIDLGSGVTELTVETVGSNPRAAIFAIQAE